MKRLVWTWKMLDWLLGSPRLQWPIKFQTGLGFVWRIHRLKQSFVQCRHCGNEFCELIEGSRRKSGYVCGKCTLPQVIEKWGET
jgi:hypothetical protein